MTKERPGRIHTCHTKGMFLKFSNAKTTVRILKIPNRELSPRGYNKAITIRELILTTMMLFDSAVIEAISCNSVSSKSLLDERRSQIEKKRMRFLKASRSEH